jgi:hypothetical protein
MFKANRKHLQGTMFSSFDTLPARERTLLSASWAQTFYDMVFMHIDETPFATLYSDKVSRPNVPVNLLLGLEWISSQSNWSDDEAMDHYYFDVQVRYGLGLRELGEQHFDIRTLYNFRRRLLEHYDETGQDLLTDAFRGITDEQIAKLRLSMKHVRMDSTQVTSNIRDYSRLQLLVEVLLRVQHMLSPADQAAYSETFGPYMRGSSDQYVYRVRRPEGAEQIQRIGQIMHELLQSLKPGYGRRADYALLQRVFDEHFVVEPQGPRTKGKDELQGGSLVAPDDPEATFRRKAKKAYKGYVTNVTETCDDDNPIQLVVEVQTAPNNVDDPTLMAEALPGIKERHADVRSAITDGGYNNEKIDELTHALGIEHNQTGIRGHRSKGMGLDAFEAVHASDGTPLELICPQGERAPIQLLKRHYHACFPLAVCDACPLRDVCRTKHQTREPFRRVKFSAHDLEIARRRRWIKYVLPQGNPRAAIESTVYTMKRPFGTKLRVRGRFRVHMKMVGSTVMVNLRRIHRWVTAPAGNPEKPGTSPQEGVSILLSLRRLGACLRLPALHRPWALA